MVAIGKTDTGCIRANNEDSIFISLEKIGALPNLFIVADGMGGHKAGEIASSSAISFFCQYIKENAAKSQESLDLLIDATSYANKMVHLKSKSDEELTGMGTTFSACTIDDEKIYIVHIGDSRIYTACGGKLKLLTNDHTFVNEMVKAGQLTEEQARTHPQKNYITKALGVNEQVAIDGFISRLDNNYSILMCTDGLNTMLTDERIYGTVSSQASMESRVDSLISMANDLGGYDNISVILIEGGAKK